MPTILRHGPYRFFFYSSDGQEPPHVHVERDSRIAKFWLDSLDIADTGKFKRSDLSNIAKIVEERRHDFLEKWNEFFVAH